MVSIRSGKYNYLIVLVALLIAASIPTLIWGAIVYPYGGSPTVTVPNPIPYTSIIPTNQSGSTEFIIPLPIHGWDVPVTVLCRLSNLTNQGICQNAPVRLNITLTLQNAAAIGSVANEYIHIGWFGVYPVDAIHVRYAPNWNSPTYPLPWSYQPDNPAEFSRFQCWSTNPNLNETRNVEYESFSDVQDVVLQDAGLLTLKIEPTIFPLNQSDSVWNDFNYYPTYSNFNVTVATPVSITSELDANRDSMQRIQQNLQYQFSNIQTQLAEDQKTETIRATSLTLFLLAFAFLDIGITLYPFSKSEDKEIAQNQNINARTKRKTREHSERTKLSSDGKTKSHTPANKAKPNGLDTVLQH